MSYTQQTWANLDPSTPLSAARLAHIESGIAAVDTALATYEPLIQAGTLAARPSPATFGKGFYLVTDQNGGTLYHSDASTWTQQAPGVTTTQGNLGYTEFGPAANAAPVSTGSTSDQDVASFTMHLGSLPGSAYDVDLKAFGYNDNATGGVWVKVKESIDSGSFATIISSIWGPTTAAGYRQFVGAIRRTPGVGGFPSGTVHTADYKVTLAAVTAGTAWLGDKFSSGVVCVLRSDQVF